MQIFIVFHKTIFDECYKNIPQEVLAKYFTFIAVNEKIIKSYDSNKYKVINEWELPVFDSSFQERGYNENSAIYHVYVNNLHKPYDYVGFFQYDMVFPENIADYLECPKENPSYYSLGQFDYHFCVDTTWNEPKTLQFVINDYEEFFNKSFDKTALYPLFNSYILSNETYERIMSWVSQLYGKLYPWCVQPPNDSETFSHIGTIYERIMGFAIGQERLSYINIPIKHDHHYKHQAY